MSRLTAPVTRGERLILAAAIIVYVAVALAGGMAVIALSGLTLGEARVVAPINHSGRAP